MKIILERFTSNSQTTIGLIRLSGLFECFSLEDEFREVKVSGETRIPPGTYDVLLRDAGGMTARYHEMFPDLHKGMLHLQDVPGFTYVYFHIGNHEGNTDGCILTGSGASISPDHKWTVNSSKDAYEAFYAKVMPAAASGNLQLTIIDRD
jgi:hypothetical protein|tara:strand:+ start:53226 stop:53675 length:450 start_codon:yes stop_codon:yes gene_type:complete